MKFFKYFSENDKKYWTELSSLRQKPTLNSVCFYYALLNVRVNELNNFASSSITSHNEFHPLSSDPLPCPIPVTFYSHPISTPIMSHPVMSHQYPCNVSSCYVPSVCLSCPILETSQRLPYQYPCRVLSL